MGPQCSQQALITPLPKPTWGGSQLSVTHAPRELLPLASAGICTYVYKPTTHHTTKNKSAFKKPMDNENQLISKILTFVSGTSTKHKYHQDRMSLLKVSVREADQSQWWPLSLLQASKWAASQGPTQRSLEGSQHQWQKASLPRILESTWIYWNRRSFLWASLILPNPYSFSSLA